MARARREESDEMNYAMGLTTPPPTAATTVYFSLDDDEDVLAARPTPLVEVRPQMGYERHCGSGFELVLDVTVPQLGRELVEVPNVVSCLRSSCRTFTFQFMVGRRQLLSPSHTCRQCFRRLSSTSHPLLQCYQHQRQCWSLLHPFQR